MSELLSSFRDALYNGAFDDAKAELSRLADDATFKHCHPFGTVEGAVAFWNACFEPLIAAMPDIERRDWIHVEGEDQHGGYWVGYGGHYLGTFTAPFLDIPPTGHIAHMRFHEFYRIENGKVVEFQAIWDIPELMMQANAWPMSPSLGREFMIPGPATLDGMGPHDKSKAEAGRQHIIKMLEHLKKHPTHPPEAMEMERFWHKNMNWYGPAGIGSGRQIRGFRHWHQIPFLNGMPDRGKYVDEIIYHFFGEGDYVAVTGWPNMIQTVTNDGWLGIAPNGKKITMRSLDFWRIEDGKIRENWVMVDMLDMYRQMDVDVFARLREFNKARHLSPIEIPTGMSA